MDVKLFREGGIAVFQVTGEINIGTSQELLKIFEKESSGKIVVDLEKVNYIDSSGLAALVEMLKTVKSRSGGLGLAGLSDKVRSLFEITKLDKLFPIYTNRARALAEMK